MDSFLKILLIVLIIWLVLYIFLEIKIILNKKNEVNKLFLNLNELFIKRFNLLTKMVDIIKGYDKNQFDSFGSKLYDYINNYDEYDINRKLKINESIDSELNKILLVSKVYPEINLVNKYVKLEKQLIRYNKIINKLQNKYNKAVKEYYNRMKIFPSNLICSLFGFYSYNYFNLKK